ncbi:hypothetical protein AOLI_G00215570 [Acnodon oligacanthus]
MQLGCHARRERLGTHLKRVRTRSEVPHGENPKLRSSCPLVSHRLPHLRIECVGGLRGVGRLVPRCKSVEIGSL